MRPHRASTVLVLGILGIPCFIFGIIAWVSANKDLKMMAAGRMDPAGRGKTNIGKICGIVGIVLAGLILILALSLVLIPGLPSSSVIEGVEIAPPSNPMASGFKISLEKAISWESPVPDKFHA